MVAKTDWARLIFGDWDKYYPLYIQSEEWNEKRIEVLRRDGYMCVCGERAEVVHILYTFSDIIVSHELYERFQL